MMRAALVVLDATELNRLLVASAAASGLIFSASWLKVSGCMLEPFPGTYNQGWCIQLLSDVSGCRLTWQIVSSSEARQEAAQAASAGETGSRLKSFLKSRLDFQLKL